ncbi:MAG: alkaline phosphatase, partial [Bacteroidales bacterium]
VLILPANILGQVKNVIIMIPDGTPNSMLSVARWYKTYKNGEQGHLAIDEYICGMVNTHCSNSPIANSSPAASTYYTGHLTLAGYLSILPHTTDRDIIKVKQSDAYKPVATLFEAAKSKGMTTGLVATCEFPHATPAAAFTHYYDRGNYDVLSKQMAYSGVDVVIAGGVDVLKNRGLDDVIRSRGYEFIENDKRAMLSCCAPRYFSLFNKEDMPYATDRDTTLTPTLAQMTEKAIKSLSVGDNGFLLMVEGSKIDWANHDNDIRAGLDDFLDFDAAVEVAIKFARSSGNTLVLVLPDHGTGGLTLGSRNTDDKYDHLSLKEIFAPIDNIKISSEKMASIIKNSDNVDLPSLFEHYCGHNLTSSEIDTLNAASDYDNSPLKERNGAPLKRVITYIINKNLNIAYTTHGHSGDNVFLAVYHPDTAKRLSGLVDNVSIAPYITRELGLGQDYLKELSDTLFIPHRLLFAVADSVKITPIENNGAFLTVKYEKRGILQIESFTDYVTVNGKKVKMSVPAVYIKENNTFYLPASLKELIK